MTITFERKNTKMFLNFSSVLTLLQNRVWYQWLFVCVMILDTTFTNYLRKLSGRNVLTYFYCAEAYYKLCKIFRALVSLEHTLGKHVEKWDVISASLLPSVWGVMELTGRGIYVFRNPEYSMLKSSWYHFTSKL